MQMGEDAAYFDVEQQSMGKWVFFTAELAAVLAILYAVRLSILQRIATLMHTSFAFVDHSFAIAHCSDDLPSLT